MEYELYSLPSGVNYKILKDQGICSNFQFQDTIQTFVPGKIYITMQAGSWEDIKNISLYNEVKKK